MKLGEALGKVETWMAVQRTRRPEVAVALAVAIAAAGGCGGARVGPTIPAQCAAPQPGAAADLDLAAWAAAQTIQGFTLEGRGSLAGGAPISRESADALVSELLTAHLVPRGRELEPLEWRQFANDCEDRAHVAVGYLIQSHCEAQIGKVFVSGELGARGQIGATDQLTWGYHVAPTVAVATGPRTFEIRVVDPAIDRERSLALSEWAEAIRREAGQTATLRLFITGPATWNWSQDEPADDRSATFCEDVRSARDNLEQFAESRPRVVTRLNDATFLGLDAQSRALFRGSAGTAFPAFTLDAATRRWLEEHREQGNAPVTVLVQRLYPPQDRLFTIFRNLATWAGNRQQTVLCVVDAPEPVGCR